MISVQQKLRICFYECTCMHWSCWYRWRGWCKPAVVISYVFILIIIVPILIYHLQTNHDVLAVWFVAGLFVLLTIPVFLASLVQHILNYTRPHLQKHIIRILWIVPVYSLNSWLALSFTNASIYFDTLRECYEAYALYNFLCYLCNFLTSEYDLVAELEARPTVQHIVPCCCMPPWPKGTVYLRRCRIGVLQYTVVRVVVTIISLITQLCGVYHKGVIKRNNAWFYLSLMNGISQAIAVNCLLYFYRGTRELLKPLHPIGKFLSVKAIIFAMFWQAVLVSILVKTHAIPDSWNKYDLQEGLQNFIVVIEMLFFAIAHYFVFSHKPYIDLAAAEVPCITTCLRMLDVRDVADDVKEHFVDPIPRPRFMMSKGGSTREVGESGENSPLLKKQREDSVTVTINPQEMQNITDASFNMLSYRELESRRTYGLRARMIANAGKQYEEDEVSNESSDSTTTTSPTSSTSSSTNCDTENQLVSCSPQHN